MNIKLLELQRDDVEHEIEKVMTKNQSKGKTATIFRTLNKICRNKKSKQEQVIMKHPATDLEIYKPDEITAVSLQYCFDLLTEKNHYDEYIDEY
jgi:hypothetical protein